MTVQRRPHWILVAIIVALLSILPGAAFSQSERPIDREQILRDLDALMKMRQDMANQMQEFDKRIKVLEEQLKADIEETEPAIAETEPEPAEPAREVDTDRQPEKWGRYEPGKGLVLARTDQGELSWSVFSYARYLNQKALDDTYTDSFGRTSRIDKRNDIQFQKVTMNFKGWLFDEKFRYLWYIWTSNTSQGEPAQVVVAGNLGYRFNDAFNLYAGIGALPSTRSTNYTFPNWLKNDHRTIADEFFRGSYTTGIFANGEIAPGLEYRVMLGNNLSQLGVNAAQLDGELNTFSGAVWWMPTTGEFGPGRGLGDFEHHDELATLFGIHYTFSTEDAQGQSDTEGFENTQLRLSDGTLIFSEEPFPDGGIVRKVDYQMAAVNAGFKYRGWSLDAEGYLRYLNDFQTIGTIPVDSLTDIGFQVQGSAMVLPKKLQAYVGFSQIFGDYGDPWDTSIGLNWFPMGRREFRINAQGLYLKDSPVGYSSVPFTVGGNGWVVSLDAIVAF
jgi:hypothetical protein